MLKTDNFLTNIINIIQKKKEIENSGKDKYNYIIYWLVIEYTKSAAIKFYSQFDYKNELKNE